MKLHYWLFKEVGPVRAGMCYWAEGEAWDLPAAEWNLELLNVGYISAPSGNTRLPLQLGNRVPSEAASGQMVKITSYAQLIILPWRYAPDYREVLKAFAHCIKEHNQWRALSLHQEVQERATKAVRTPRTHHVADLAEPGVNEQGIIESNAEFYASIKRDARLLRVLQGLDR
jgi:hypothetical protein